MKNLKWKNHSDLAIRRTPTVFREEYLDYMTFKSNQRPLFTEIFGPMIGLKEEWEEQGATPEELDFSAFRYRCEARGAVPVNTGRNGGYPEAVIEETGEYRITRDSMGRTMKLLKGAASLPLPLDYPVKTMDDWLKIKAWYQFQENRFAPDWKAKARKIRNEEKVVCVYIPGGFDEPRQLLGEEQLCLACYEQPELIHDILDTISATAFKVLEQVSASVPVDLLFVHEDMAGKSGSLFGPMQINEFIKPYYRKLWDMLQSRGARIFEQDSDGNMNSVIDAFLDSGLNCMYPMEPAAGMDIVQVRAKYGIRLAITGGIDKHVLRKSQKEILAELEYKIPPMLKTGGCVIALDHRVPNGTPLANYRFYIQKVWEMIEQK
jgi:uroporphyrinogen-III decarboxylase